MSGGDTAVQVERVRLLPELYNDTPDDSLGWDLRIWAERHAGAVVVYQGFDRLVFSDFGGVARSKLHIEIDDGTLTLQRGIARIVFPVECFAQFASELTAVVQS